MKRFSIAQGYSSGFDTLDTTDNSQGATLVVQPQTKTGGPDNRHPGSDQWIYVIAGAGRAIIAGREAHLDAGTILLVEAGEPHEILCLGDEPLVMFTVFSPPIPN
jgi:mannose-6-phosphate isomerase-like protein (cupin superfamily)